MKKFFVLLGILASAMVTQSAFATFNNKCVWDGSLAPGSEWTCVSTTHAVGFAAPKYYTGISCAIGGVALCNALAINDDCLNFGTHCGEIKKSASFTFNIAAGGADLQTYVCEAGFANRHCPNCGSELLKFYTGNHVAFDASPFEHTGTAAQNVLKYWLFTRANAPTSADLFLNDLNVDSGFYVKYCADITRLWVGDLPHHPAIFTLNDRLTLTPGGVGTYFDSANLRAMVFKSCDQSKYNLPGLPGTLVDPFGLPGVMTPWQQFADFGDDNHAAQTIDFLGDIFSLVQGATHDGETCFTGHCSWTVLYKEMNHCMVRSTVAAGPNCPNGICGEARRATINTTLDLNLDFCPLEGDCD